MIIASTMFEKGHGSIWPSGQYLLLIVVRSQ